MYNYSINLNYINSSESQIDTTYRKEFLSVFDLKQYDDSIVSKTLNNIFQKYKEHPQFKQLLDLEINTIPIPMPPQTKFTFLFSFHNFFYTHKCLQDLNNSNNISDENFINLKNIIQKK